MSLLCPVRNGGGFLGLPSMFDYLPFGLAGRQDPAASGDAVAFEHGAGRPEFLRCEAVGSPQQAKAQSEREGDCQEWADFIRGDGAVQLSTGGGGVTKLTKPVSRETAKTIKSLPVVVTIAPCGGQARKQFTAANSI